ncbi:hypothetical protein BXZ70DRAFT_440582 [Cristinia sonorae]|uniref:Uncharacterized protein n=1 Tax=Cristinia sonorae TaxID=1940300 RepID=A0A8K0XMB8_9AGAR|nr:hypothetical protein BXZ70DRAFT_440582 [Cristinia sonorae]
MAESRPRLPQSQIPVKAFGPRHAQGASPGSLPSPNFTFVASSQHLSVGDSPSHPISVAGCAPTPSASISTFRSFRNLLPFGPTKPQIAATNPVTPSKNGPFSNIRRSMNGERSVSAPQLRPKKSQEDPPTLSIQLSHKVDEPLIKPEDLRGGLGLYMKQPEPPPPQSAPAVSQRFQPSHISPPSPGPIGVSDLSTILESETSGISKHAPNLDDSSERHTNSSPRQNEERKLRPDTLDIRLSRPSEQQLLVPPGKRERLPSPDSRDTSALDLSTSKVSNEVLEALVNDHQQGWSHGIVIDEADGHGMDGLDDPNASFNMTSLDPDLAALLSPNNLKSPDHGLLRSIDTLSLPPTTPPMTDSHLASPSASLFTPLPSAGPSPSKTTYSDASPAHLGRSVTTQSSPVRRPAPLTRSASSSAVPSPISVPTRSPSFQIDRSKTLLPSPSFTAAERTSVDTAERPSSAGPSASASRRRGYSQITGDSELPRRPHTGGESEARRPVLSRLMTPVRPALQLNGNGSRSTLRGGSTKTSPSAWDSESVSPSRPQSSLGGRPSLDSSADRFKNSPLVRGRDRSASVTERPATYYGSSGRPPVTDWLGPRTAKAFAAAGLIDVDKEASQPGPSRPASRFSTTRSQTERDSGSRYAPSRMAFSEAGSGSSWGRRSGSISRTGAMSEVNGPLSESASTPRTTFSTGSTALTSVSGSSVQQHLQSELQAIQDKHALETGALLNALADSQRTSKMLRDENTQLRDRLHELEDRLADAVNEMQRLQYQSSLQQSSSSYSRGSSYPRSSLRPGDNAGIRKRPSALQNVMHADADEEEEEETTEIRFHAPPSHMSSARSSSESRREDTYAQPLPPKRFSNASSIFPVPPSTMSMLLHEEGLAPEAYSARSRSPSARRASQGSYGHQRFNSNDTAMTAGNISPTTANFSMLTGSPGSLSLRSEHERLLGDMPPLNLNSDDYDFDGVGN